MKNQTMIIAWPELMTEDVASMYLALDSDTFRSLAARFSVDAVEVGDSKPWTMRP